MVIRKKEIVKTIVCMGAGIGIMTFMPGIWFLGYFALFIGGFNIPNIFKKKYLCGTAQSGYCFHCEKHKVSILIYDTPEGKVYEWFCSNCKRYGSGTGL